MTTTSTEHQSSTNGLTVGLSISLVLLVTVWGNLLTDPSNRDREISVTTNNISVDVSIVKS